MDDAGKNKINVYFTEQNVLHFKCIRSMFIHNKSVFFVLLPAILFTLIISFLSEYTMNALYNIHINICSYYREQNTIKFIKLNNLLLVS